MGCEELTTVDAAALIAWVSGIAFTDWPQQPSPDGQLRPAMACDPNWHGFKEMTDPIVNEMMGLFPGTLADTRMLSVVMPGRSIPAHVDLQSGSWQCRIHVPLSTNGDSLFIVGGRSYRMEIGKAYKVDTRVEHSVENKGATPRVHFIFDVRNNA